jgi:hypothetical protein
MKLNTLLASIMNSHHYQYAKSYMKPTPYHQMASWSQNNVPFGELATLLSGCCAIIQQWSWPHESWWEGTLLLAQKSLNFCHKAALVMSPSQHRGVKRQWPITDQFYLHTWLFNDCFALDAFCQELTFKNVFSLCKLPTLSTNLAWSKIICQYPWGMYMYIH